MSRSPAKKKAPAAVVARPAPLPVTADEVREAIAQMVAASEIWRLVVEADGEDVAFAPLSTVVDNMLAAGSVLLNVGSALSSSDGPIVLSFKVQETEFGSRCRVMQAGGAR